MPALPYRELRVEQSESVVNRPTRTRYNGIGEGPFCSSGSLQRHSQRFERWAQHSGPLLETARITTPKRIPFYSVVRRVCGSAVRRSRVRAARRRARVYSGATGAPRRSVELIGTAKLERFLGRARTSSASSIEHRIRSERRASNAHDEACASKPRSCSWRDGAQRRRPMPAPPELALPRSAQDARAATRAPTIAARFSCAGEGSSTARRRALR